MVAPDTIKPSIAATSHTIMRRAVGGGMHVDAPLIARRTEGPSEFGFLDKAPGPVRPVGTRCSSGPVHSG